MLSPARASLVAAPVIATLSLIAPRPGAAVVFNLALEEVPRRCFMELKP